MSRPIAVGILTLVLIATPITAYLVSQNQNPNTKASDANGTALVSVSPTTVNLDIDETQQMKIYFNTNGLPVNLVQVGLRYQFSGTTPSVDADNVQIDQGLKDENPGDWGCTIHDVDVVAPYVDIKVSCSNTSGTGYTSTSNKLLATFDLTANAVPTTNPFQITFDTANSHIYERVPNADPREILQTPTGTVSVSVTGDSNDSPTHLLCINNACVKAAGEGEDKCSTAGASCTSTFSQAAKTNCTGQYDPNCYNCIDDDAINILDFACFRSAFGRERTGGVNW